MRLYMLIMMQTALGWRRTKFVEEMPPHDDRDHARLIAEQWAKYTIPSHMSHEPYIAVVIRAAGPHARPQYITHQTVNVDGVKSADIMRAVKCNYGESYPEQFKPWDKTGATMAVNSNDKNVCLALSRSHNHRPATKNQVDSVVLPFIDRMMRQ